MILFQRSDENHKLSQIFSRSKFVRTTKQEKSIICCEACHVDTWHEMNLNLYIDLLSHTVVRAEGQIIRAPYTICVEATNYLDRLEGLVLVSGTITKEIQKRVGGTNGCTHLVDLILECIKAFRQSEVMVSGLESDEMIRQYHERLKGSCYTHGHSVEEKIEARQLQRIFPSW